MASKTVKREGYEVRGNTTTGTTVVIRTAVLREALEAMAAASEERLYHALRLVKVEVVEQETELAVIPLKDEVAK